MLRQVLDKNGRTIEKRNTQLARGIQTQTFNLSKQAPGMYFIKVITAEGTSTAKVIMNK